jgi:hypothetical protein
MHFTLTGSENLTAVNMKCTIFWNMTEYCAGEFHHILDEYTSIFDVEEGENEAAVKTWAASRSKLFPGYILGYPLIFFIMSLKMRQYFVLKHL